jgi:hypothetical protein
LPLELPLEVTRLFKPTSMKKIKRFGTACIELGTHRLGHEEGCNVHESAKSIQKCHTDVGSLVSPASWKLVSSLVPRLDVKVAAKRPPELKASKSVAEMG